MECLEKDPDGTLVPLYDNSKNYRLGRRLPIAKATAAVITDQQERVRERFPNTPAGKLKLLASPVANPGGTKPSGSIGDAHRARVDALPDIMMPVVVEVEGQLVTKMLPFDKSKIFPYAYQHSFAQRHADANIAPDVLMDLDLLRSRERLMSAFEADDWARSEAMTSDGLSEEERAQVEKAVAVVRRGRVVMLGTPRVGQPLPDVRPWRLP
ncbi:hypothetical protein [Streptomyces atratus]|uniref:hypothetical protein n=1 Tax=Streptomyces atratus TaxID=1893 RepID=UPI0033E30ACE